MSETKGHASYFSAAKFLALVLSLSFGAVLLVKGVTGRVAEPDRSYSEEIARTYEFKFGPNPFSPGNATTTTGAFISGVMFVASKRCGTCHTNAHAHCRQSRRRDEDREAV